MRRMKIHIYTRHIDLRNISVCTESSFKEDFVKKEANYNLRFCRKASFEWNNYIHF